MRKTFQLGGATFAAPEIIGAGIRARASQITADIAEEKNVKISMNEVITRYFYDYSLRLLELILTPEPNSPSIKEAYDSATDEEVQEVMSFFAESASGKTQSVSGRTSGSGNSKRTAKQSI